MGHLPYMDDFTLDVVRTIDTMIDEAELLPFRYQNVLDLPTVSATLIL
jgi:hypothetical protein